MTTFRTILSAAAGLSMTAAAILVAGATTRSAQAGTIILEGSDSIGFHSPFGDAGAITYRDQVWNAIGGASPKPIAVIGTGTGPITSGSHAISDFASVAAAGPLSNYVALYFVAGGGCCQEDDSLPAGNEAAISAYLAAGGTVMIENYTGGSAWDFAVGTGGAGNAHVAGVGGGLGGSSCSDGELVTADGTLNGFTQPPVIGCWTHQGYDMSFFGPLGFGHNFYDSPSDIGGAGFSSLLSSGITVSNPASGVPEPATLSIIGLGLAALGLARRRKSA